MQGCVYSFWIRWAAAQTSTHQTSLHLITPLKICYCNGYHGNLDDTRAGENQGESSSKIEKITSRIVSKRELSWSQSNPVWLLHIVFLEFS